MTRPVPDARVLKTYQRLTDALVALTLERGCDALTVRELTERAEVGYATFFRHFSSKEALLGLCLRALWVSFWHSWGRSLRRSTPSRSALEFSGTPATTPTATARSSAHGETLNLQERCLRGGASRRFQQR